MKTATNQQENHSKISFVKKNSVFQLFGLVGFVYLGFLFPDLTAYGQSQVVAIAVEDDSIRLDGKLNEKIWNTKPQITDFTQREPFEGNPATNKVDVFIGYSEKYLYLAGRIYKPRSTVQHVVSRRDNSANSERIIFTFDTFLDKITSYSFGITAAAVRLDYFHPSDNAFDRDYSWNPIWEAKTEISEEDWTFEAKIPFSQLRFNRKEEVKFGLNINHYVPNTNEDAFWVHIPRDEAGWASHFQTIEGFNSLAKPIRTEFLPYLAADMKRLASVDANNPFVSKTSYSERVGADVKWGIGSNLTMDATINPDFGQVEADPAFVNLTQFEIVQSERRPFFTEGAALFNGGGTRYFYSRRIGSVPSYVPDGDYVQVNANSTILGAVKLTGRLKSGLSVGVMNAETGREYAQVNTIETGTNQRILAEPLTNYSIVRFVQEFGKYGSRIGFITTNVVRQLNTPELESLLNKTATTAGTDWMIRFNKRMYEFKGHFGLSHITGTKEAILAEQTASARYFQRPDSPHISLDSSRTSLTGITASGSFAKVEGNTTYELGFATESPELELNDLGVLQSSDDIVTYASVGYRILTPNDYFNRIGFETGARMDWNYGGLLTRKSIYTEAEYLFPRFQRIGIFWEKTFEAYSDDYTRGGPIMKRPNGYYLNLSTNSNRGAAILLRFTTDYFENDEGSKGYGFFPAISGMLAGKWEFSLSPRYSYNQENRQYITQIERLDGRTYGKRYIFSEVNRSTWSIQTRLNYSFTPDLSLEMYIEPFVSDGEFKRFGELAEAKNNVLNYYGTGNTTIALSDNKETFIIQDGTERFELDNPDFRVLSFRSNLVIRYEWIAGSTFFLVWQQNRSEYDSYRAQVRPADLMQSIGIPGNHIFAVKISYWIPSSRIFK